MIIGIIPVAQVPTTPPALVNGHVRKTGEGEHLFFDALKLLPSAIPNFSIAAIYQSVLSWGKEVDGLDFDSVQFFFVASALLLPITFFVPYSIYAGRTIPPRCCQFSNTR